MLAEQKNMIDLVEIVEKAGVELRRSGSRLVAPCPFHDDKTPSFYIFDNQRFHCFGCGAHGDVIDFVQKYYKVSFKEALRHLGVKQGKVTPRIRKEIELRKRKAEAVKRFRRWESRYAAYVGDMILRTEKLMEGISPDDLYMYAPLLHMLPVWEHHLEILMSGSDELKFELYKDVVT